VFHHQFDRMFVVMYFAESNVISQCEFERQKIEKGYYGDGRH